MDFYLPPFSTPDIGDYKNTGKRFAFTATPTTINIDTTQESLIGVKRWHTRTWRTIYFNKVFTFIYKPYHFKTISDDGKGIETRLEVGVSNSEELGNRYYTLIDVLFGDTLPNLLSNMNSYIRQKENKVDSIIRAHKRKIRFDNNSEIWKNNDEKIIVDRVDNREMHPTFVFTDKKTYDTIYCTYPKKFFLVPFIVKQKQLYEGKKLIFENSGYEYTSRNILSEKNDQIVVSDKSEWYCSKIDLINNGYGYKLYYVLKNNKGTIITINDLAPRSNANFITLKEYKVKQQNKRLEKEKLLAEQKRKEKLKRQKEKGKARKTQGKMY
ncbi:MAG: hypothetical protein U5L09_01770 [Bacteroidales bacterium]|nr:hypothetical protein [Bacteroidales bacterium]